MRSFCQKAHVREKSGSGVTAPKVVKSTYFQRRISRERVEQIQICFDFQKVRCLVFRKFAVQIFPISTPSPRKLSSKFGSQKGPKNGFPIFSTLCCWILFKLHKLLDINTGLNEWKFQVNCISGSGVMGIFVNTDLKIDNTIFYLLLNVIVIA